MDRWKVRLRFAKTGPLRFVSHHDLVRCLERMMRRAGVPFKSTEGFHPQPRLALALSLPLGVAGLDEVAEIELTRPADPAEVLAALRGAAPEGLAVHSARTVEPASRNAQVCCVGYHFDVPAERQTPELDARVAELRDRETLWCRRTRPQEKVVNARAYLRELGWDAGRLSFEIWVAPTGTAKAEEYLAFLGLRDLPHRGGVLIRARMDVSDEQPPGSPSLPDWESLRERAGGRAEGCRVEIDLDGEPAFSPPAPPDLEWGASPNGPVVQ